MNESNSVELPIFIVADGSDVSVYDSEEKAERALEPIDILEGIYVGYDAEGRLLSITPNRYIAKIELAEKEPTHVNELREALVEFFLELGASKLWLAQATLQELVLKSLDYKEKY